DTNSVCPFDHSAEYQYCLRGFIPRGSLLYSRALVTIQVRLQYGAMGGAPVDCPLEQRLRKGSFAKPSINSRSSPLSSRALVPLRAAPPGGGSALRACPCSSSEEDEYTLLAGFASSPSSFPLGTVSGPASTASVASIGR
ncbi:hypothetical protein JG688_00016906, partial [Phytophthora aleatoria]